MERTTIMLPSDLKEKAFFKASELKISFGELVRKSLEDFISQEKLRKIDIFLDDDNIYIEPIETDLAKNHDKYIYGD